MTTTTAASPMTTRRHVQRGCWGDIGQEGSRGRRRAVRALAMMRAVDRRPDLLAAMGPHPALEALAGEEGVHVVGGAVRDALLGRAPHELDFVVEGDAVAV